MSSPIKPYFPAALLMLTLVGCATATLTPSTEATNISDRVVIGRDTVAAHAFATVFELLEARTPRFRSSMSSFGRAPLVVVDGVQVEDGINVLSTMRAADADRIDLMWSTDATTRYGSRAAAGAIIIRSRVANRAR